MENRDSDLKDVIRSDFMEMMRNTNKNSIKFKAYVVMAYYARQGWNAVAEFDTFQEAAVERERWLGNGITKVNIFMPVDIVYVEKLRGQYGTP